MRYKPVNYIVTRLQRAASLTAATMQDMMAPMPQPPLTERIPDLLPTIAAWRDEGASYEAIARRLADERNLHVSQTTVYRWLAAERGAA